MEEKQQTYVVGRVLRLYVSLQKMVVAFPITMEIAEDVTSQELEVSKEYQVKYDFFQKQLKAMLEDIPR